MDDIEWNVINEGQLLEAMIGHKPVGINKYFQMAFICDKFADNYQKEINPENIWQHLETMYNLEALDESESLPFPNNEKDFQLPESEFGNLLNKKDDDEKKHKGGRETPKQIKEIKKDDKSTANSRNSKERRDSRDSKEKITTTSIKKDKRESMARNRGNSTPKDDVKTKGKNNDDTPKPSKRPTRGSFKPDDSNSSGKSSPTPMNLKRRRI